LEAATTTINSLMQSISGGTSAATVTIGASETLQVGAITIVSGAGALTLGTAANSGTLKPATAGGALLLINNGNTMTINSVIADNTSASSVTKDGTGALTLAANNTFSGGTVISGGTLIISANASLGALTAPLTLNANATLPNSINYGTRPVVLNNGAIFYCYGISSVTIGGTISGDGGFQVSNNGPQAGSGKVYLTNTGNTFTGPLVLSGGNYNPAFTVASIGDAPGAGQIQFAGGNSADFIVSGGSSPIVLNYRQFKLAYDWHTPTISNNNGSDANTLTVNTDLIVTATANLVFVLGGSNTGMNTFAGRIANGPVSVISLTKADAGTWILLGTNTYSGVTTISAGKLSINSLANVNGGASALGNPSSVANGTLSMNGVTLQYTGSGHTSDRVVNLSGTTVGAVLDASGTGPLVLTSALTATGAGSKTLTLAGTSTATNTLAGAIVDNGGANKTSLIKTNAGTWVLAGSNTYTGTTTLRGGTLTGVTGGSCLGSSLTVTNTPGVTSALGVTVNDNTKQWSCANLAFTTNGLGSQLQFSFAVAPSTSLAPLSVTNSLTFTGAPVVVVNLANVPPGIYPLVVVGGATAPTVVPALELMNAATKGGSLAWGGTGNKTLYLTVSSKATVILFR
jgi:autotransporter-associated beta strand protein